MHALTVRQWTTPEWLGSEVVWSALLARSNADPLFLSWGWLTHWWQCYGDILGRSPRIVAFYSAGHLVGIAPLYHRRVRRGVLPTHSVQLIGLSWRDPEALISEYLDVIACPEYAPAVRRACVNVLLEDPAWQELVVGLTAAGSQWRESLSDRIDQGGFYVRELDRSVSYQADLACGFDAYRQSLSQSARRSIWHLRRRLAEHGEVQLERVMADDIDTAFRDLNRLHRLRWNRPAFEGTRLTFHSDLARRLSVAGELALSRLRVAGRVVSVLYDLRKGARQYNIKMAFDPSFSHRLSLGLIHLGFAMEQAADSGVTVYDLLAGPGQRSDYKRHLGQTRRELSCFQVLRGSVLPSLYRWYDRIR